jgi:lia operon protein LiaG
MKKFLILLVCIVLLLPATGCGLAFSWGGHTAIGPGQTFDVNDHGAFDLQGVNNIRIVTVSDNAVVLAGGSQADATLKGQCSSTTKPEWLDARKEGDTVVFEVKYPVGTTSSSTVLTVTIPESYQGNLSVTTVSGDILAGSLPFRLQQVNLGTVSGDVQFGVASFTRLDAGTTSGEINIAGIAAPVTVHSVSGNIGLDYTEFAATQATTVSGDVTATIPANASFKVDFGSISGGFSSNYPALSASSSKAGFSGATATGAQTIKVNTTSANFEIKSK